MPSGKPLSAVYSPSNLNAMTTSPLAQLNDPTLLKTDALINGQWVAGSSRFAGLPRHSAKLALDWKAGNGLTLGAEVRAVSSQGTQGNEDGLSADTEDGEAPQRADLRTRGYALLALRLGYKPQANWELYARVNNAANRRYETFGAVAADMFPGGQLASPHGAGGEAELGRFVAPGAPRSISAGLRYRF
eukprot:gene23317-29529_t